MGKLITNQQVLDSPAPGQLRYGVFDVARPLAMDTRIIGSGLQFLTDHCGITAAEYDQTCDTSPVKPIREGSELVTADPYWIVARTRCGSVGRTAEMALSAARQQLATSAQTRVEAVIWDSGALPTATPTLTGAGATIVTPLAPGAGAAISALERAFYAAGSGYAGVIHISTRAEGALTYAGLMDPGDRVAGVYKTKNRTSIVLGDGYGVTGPADAAPAAGFAWAFITSPLTIWRSGVLPQPPATQTFDRALNQWDTVAEEVFAHAWDCPDVFAVQVPLAAPATAATPAVP